MTVLVVVVRVADDLITACGFKDTVIGPLDVSG